MIGKLPSRFADAEIPREMHTNCCYQRSQVNLMQGFLDGSFRSTVSGLQDLEYLPYQLDTRLFPLKVALEQADKHDRDGSYDEVIGATAGFLWLRSKGLGNDHEQTKQTLAWLRERFSRVDARERLYVLSILHDAGMVDEQDTEIAIETLSELTPIDASELELLAFLGAAVKFDQEQIALSVLRRVFSPKRRGWWSDLGRYTHDRVSRAGFW